jgi:hypothetical protein
MDLGLCRRQYKVDRRSCYLIYLPEDNSKKQSGEAKVEKIRETFQGDRRDPSIIQLAANPTGVQTATPEVKAKKPSESK